MGLEDWICILPCCKAQIGLSTLVSEPLNCFMDYLALVQTIRDRLYLKARGLSLPGSECNRTLDDLLLMNWRLMNGDAALDSVVDFSETLEAHPDSELLLPFDLTFSDMFPHVFSTMCDTFRRLYLPSRRIKFRFLRLGILSMEEAVPFLSDCSREPSCCSGYPFAEADGNEISRSGLHRDKTWYIN